MSEIYQESLNLHRLHQGKLATNSKVPLKSKHDLALAYTPGVAEACRVIVEKKEEAANLTIKGNTVAIISDGSAVLGLGNIGPLAALPVMEGKCILFKEFANLDAFPICLDTQDQEEIIKTIKYIAPAFGAINLEDISAPRCFEIEKRLKEELNIPIMHDDQHGTATVVLAALINSLKLQGAKKETVKIVINGAGSAGSAIADLLTQYGFQNIIIHDKQGAIYSGRNDLNENKTYLAKITNPKQLKGSLAENLIQADVFIGVSAPAILNQKMIKTMASKAIIFALANPIPEIMPEEAKEAGAFIIATGRSDYPNQINNVLAFPGIFRGALDNKTKKIEDKMLIRAAQNLADLVTDLNQNNILPDPFDPRVVKSIAQAIY